MTNIILVGKVYSLYLIGIIIIVGAVESITNKIMKKYHFREY